MKSKLILISTLAILVSCGKKSEGIQNAHSNSYGTTEGRLCDTGAISDYNKLALICSISNDVDRSAVSNCITQADAMLGKYPNINCQASKSSGSTLDDKIFTINASSVSSLQGRYTHENYLNYKDGKKCGIYFWMDFYELAVNKCKEFSMNSKSEVTVCVDGLRNFMVRYNDVNCYTDDVNDTLKSELLENKLSELVESLK